MTMTEFLNQLTRLRFIDRADLPKTDFWDEDWLLFQDSPFLYFLRCSDQHQEDIWQALERDRVKTPEEHTDETLPRCLGGNRA